VTKYIAMIVLNLAAPKAGAKRELLFNKPASVSMVLMTVSLETSIVLHLGESIDIYGVCVQHDSVLIELY
jgi:hypothetical protein